MATKATTTGRQSAATSTKANGPKASTTVATRASTAVATIDKDFAAELENDGGRGFEEANRDAFAIPFLSILQDLSPQTKSKMPGFIPGAKPGQIFQSVSQAVLDNVRVIPCHYSQIYIEWVPRSKGGGFVAMYDPVAGAAKALTGVRDGGQLVLPNGNEIYDTRQHFCLMVNEDGSTEPCLMALKSAGLKISRRWMSQMKTAMIEVAGKMIQPPMFAWSYLLGSEEEANDKGSWYQWAITDRERVVDINLYRQAKSFGASMAQGKVKVNYEEMMNQADNMGRGGTQGEVPNDLNNEM